jgi:hypothetical protein
VSERLEKYLALIDQERHCRPAEAMLLDEILRLRSDNRRLVAFVDDVRYQSISPIARKVADALLEVAS